MAPQLRVRAVAVARLHIKEISFIHLALKSGESKFKMSQSIPSELLAKLTATNGKVIVCKAAVAWEAKKPLDITDIEVKSCPTLLEAWPKVT